MSGAYFSQKLHELVDKFDIAVEARGVGAIQALQLRSPASRFWKARSPKAC